MPVDEVENADQPVPQPEVVRGLLPLFLVFGCVGTITLGIAAWLSGGPMVLSAALSLLVCLIGAVLGYLASIYPRGDFYIVSRLYLSMAARAGIPLALLIVCKTNADYLFSQGMVYFVILFYLVGLVVDLRTRMAMLSVQQTARDAGTIGTTAKIDG